MSHYPLWLPLLKFSGDYFVYKEANTSDSVYLVPYYGEITRWEHTNPAFRCGKLLLWRPSLGISCFREWRDNQYFMPASTPLLFTFNLELECFPENPYLLWCLSFTQFWSSFYQPWTFQFCKKFLHFYPLLCFLRCVCVHKYVYVHTLCICHVDSLYNILCVYVCMYIYTHTHIMCAYVHIYKICFLKEVNWKYRRNPVNPWINREHLLTSSLFFLLRVKYFASFCWYCCHTLFLNAFSYIFESSRSLLQVSWTVVAPGHQKRSIKLANSVCRAPQNVLKCHHIVTKYLWVAEPCLRSKVGTEAWGRVDISEWGRREIHSRKQRGWGREKGIWNAWNMGGSLFSPSWTQGQSLARMEIFSLTNFSHSGASISLSSAA